MPTPLRAEPDAAGNLTAPVETILAQKLHPKIRAFVEYWRSIAPPGEPAGRLPGRQHFDPMAIPALLPNLWLVDVERTPRLRFRYRLIGTSVARAYAEDSTGRYLDEAHEGFDRTQVKAYLSEVVERRLPSWRTGRPKFFALQDFLKIERVYLPAARDGAAVDLILALTIFLDRFGREY